MYPARARLLPVDEQQVPGVSRPERIGHADAKRGDNRTQAKQRQRETDREHGPAVQPPWQRTRFTHRQIRTAQIDLVLVARGRSFEDSAPATQALKLHSLVAEFARIRTHG